MIRPHQLVRCICGTCGGEFHRDEDRPGSFRFGERCDLCRRAWLEAHPEVSRITITQGFVIIEHRTLELDKP